MIFAKVSEVFEDRQDNFGNLDLIRVLHINCQVPK